MITTEQDDINNFLSVFNDTSKTAGIYGEFLRNYLYPLSKWNLIYQFDTIEIWFDNKKDIFPLLSKLCKMNGFDIITEYETKKVTRKIFRIIINSKTVDVHIVISDQIPETTFREDLVYYSDGKFLYNGSDNEREELLSNLNNKVLTHTPYQLKKLNMENRFAVKRIEDAQKSGWKIMDTQLIDPLQIKEEVKEEGVGQKILNFISKGLIEIAESYENTFICSHIRRDGLRCTNETVMGENKCKTHMGLGTNNCCAIKKNGEPCKLKAMKDRKTCAYHS